MPLPVTQASSVVHARRGGLRRPGTNLNGIPLSVPVPAPVSEAASAPSHLQGRLGQGRFFNTPGGNRGPATDSQSVGSPSDSGESQPGRPLISVPLGPVCRRPGESAARPLGRPTWHVGLSWPVVAVSEKKNGDLRGRTA